jgi:hypothetical protein
VVGDFATPLFQTNFFPDLSHVKSLPFAVFFYLRNMLLSLVLDAACAGTILATSDRTISAAKTFFITNESLNFPDQITVLHR